MREKEIKEFGKINEVGKSFSKNIINKIEAN